jgi:hypothetical protein
MLYSLAKARGGQSEQLHEADPLLGGYFPLSRLAVLLDRAAQIVNSFFVRLGRGGQKLLGLDAPIPARKSIQKFSHTYQSSPSAR